jgi:hypothetical protein
MQRQTRIGMQAECNRCGRHREPVFHIPLYVRITHVHAPPRRCLPTPITGPHWLTHTAMPPPCAWSGRNGEYMHKKYRSARTSGWAVVTARFDMRILPKLNTNAHACEHLQGPHHRPGHSSPCTTRSRSRRSWRPHTGYNPPPFPILLEQ